MTSASCSFKTCKMESPTKTNSSCQTLTSWILPLEIPMAIVDNTNDLEQLEQLMILLYHKLSITWKPR